MLSPLPDTRAIKRLMGANAWPGTLTPHAMAEAR
jgi:hypothetical protein